VATASARFCDTVNSVFMATGLILSGKVDR
jgi:hypothetical protein